MRSPDVIVIGAGLAGLYSAVALAEAGASVTVLAMGMGSLSLLPGTVDVLGRGPGGSPVKDIPPAVEELVATNPRHPYTMTGPFIAPGLERLAAWAAEGGLPYRGHPGENLLLPTPMGTFRPTCLVPEGYAAGALPPGSASSPSGPAGSGPAAAAPRGTGGSRGDEKWLLLGFREFRDFYPEFAAAEISRRGVEARGAFIELPQLGNRHSVTSLDLARLLDTDKVLEALAAAGDKVLKDFPEATKVGLPAVLGMNHHRPVMERLEEAWQRPVFEIPTLPPSVPGLRLNHVLYQRFLQAGGVWVVGAPARWEPPGGAGGPGGGSGAPFVTVSTQAAGRRRRWRAGHVILATGGLISGGLRMEYDGTTTDTVFGLPAVLPGNGGAPDGGPRAGDRRSGHPDSPGNGRPGHGTGGSSRASLLEESYLPPGGHAVEEMGLAVDGSLAVAVPGVEAGRVLAVGTTLAGARRMAEGSRQGVALSSAAMAVNIVTGNGEEARSEKR